MNQSTYHHPLPLPFVSGQNGGAGGSLLPLKGAGGSSFGGSFLLLLLVLLLSSCGPKTERFAGKVNDKCPIDIGDGKIQPVTFNGHEMIVNVNVNSATYDFVSLNSHKEAAKQIRTYQLALFGEKTMFGHLLRLAYDEGYELTLTYQNPAKKGKDNANTVEFTPLELQNIFDKVAMQSPQKLNMLITIEYINLSLPHQIDPLTTQDKAYFSNGNLVIRYNIDTTNIDWNMVLKNKSTLKNEIIDGLKEECKQQVGMRSILKQCLSSGYNYVYEYQSKQDVTKNLRFTFNPQEIKSMLF